MIVVYEFLCLHALVFECKLIQEDENHRYRDRNESDPVSAPIHGHVHPIVVGIWRRDVRLNVFKTVQTHRRESPFWSQLNARSAELTEDLKALNAPSPPPAMTP